MSRAIVKHSTFEKIQRPILDNEVWYSRKIVFEYAPKIKHLFDCLDISIDDLFFFWGCESPKFYEKIGDIKEPKNRVNKTGAKVYHLFNDCPSLDNYLIEYVIPEDLLNRNDFELIGKYVQWFEETLKRIKLEDSYKMLRAYNNGFAGKHGLNQLDYQKGDSIIKHKKIRYSLVEQHLTLSYFDYQVDEIHKLKAAINNGDLEFSSYSELKYKAMELFFEYVKWINHSRQPLPEAASLEDFGLEMCYSCKVRNFKK